jgi:hypothetical protein
VISLQGWSVSGKRVTPYCFVCIKLKMSNKEQGKGWRRPSHSKHYSYAFVYVRPMAITRVCTDYNRYLKIGPNHKKRVLDCRARQALFALKTTIIS